ncbi:hypothetical protein NTCA1_28550 [Novosphingobium sp. TCA1]|nr:hypothetical protein NTCA1_28550 [Novosphingobium sp. TCA1]
MKLARTKLGSMKLSKGAITTAALGISSGLNFLSLIVWTHLLSPAEFGTYALVSATVLFLNAAIFEWLRLTASRLLYDPAAEHQLNPEIANALSMVCLGLILLLLPVALSLRAFQIHFLGVAPDWWPAMWLWLFSEMLFAISTVTARLRLLSWRFFAMMTLRSSLSLAAGAVLVWVFDMGALGVALGILGAQIGCAVLGNLTDAAWRGLRPFRARRADLQEIMRYGAPLIVSSGLGYASAVADRYIVSSTLGQAAVGQYSVSVDLMQKTVIFLMLAVNLSAYPAIVRAFEKDGREAGEKILAENFIVYLMIGAPAAAILAALSPGVARLFVGPSFRDTVAMLLPYVAIAAILKALTTFHLSVALQLVKKTKLLIISPAVNLALLVPSGIVGVKLAGLTGMAIGIAISQIGSFALFYLVVSRHVRTPLLTRSSLFVVVLSLVLGAALVPLRGFSEPVACLGLLAAAGLVYCLVIWRGRGWIMRNSQSWSPA